MGNTCASVHVALTGTSLDPVKGIVRAYKKLGFERAKTPSPEGGKHVVLLRKEEDAFLSVYDSDNATLDTGELKDLALVASKIFKTGDLHKPVRQRHVRTRRVQWRQAGRPRPDGPRRVQRPSSACSSANGFPATSFSMTCLVHAWPPLN